IIDAFAALAALECQHPAMKSAPDYKVPRCAVPKSTDKHRDDKVRIRARKAVLIAADGDVKVFAQPCRKRDVPAPPKISDRLCEIWRIKIFREHESKHKAEPDRHVCVTAEIEINLERIRDRSKPCIKRLNRARIECRIRDFTAWIRQQDLFRQPHHEKRDAARELVGCKPAIFQLIGEERKFQNRPGHKVREHRDEAGEIDKVRHSLGITAIDVDRVTEGLKRVEADAERQHYAKKRVQLRALQSDALQQRVVTIDAEVEVFEKTQDNEIADDRDRDCCPPHARFAVLRIDKFHWLSPDSPDLPGIVRDDQTHQPIDERCAEHERHESWLRPAVKCISSNDQPGVTPALLRAKQRVINEQRERQKIIDKYVRAKYHA